MAQSPEYPDLKWVEPASWTNANRSSVQLIVIHTTEGSARSTSAEDGAAYDARRTDGTSTHYFHDSDSTVQCVRTEDQAHAARTQGNKRGIQHELCGGAYSLDWSSDYALALLKVAAKQAARDAKKWGIPVRKLTSSQVAAGTKGFCGHVDVTNAFPQDNGTHTDPGPSFPWSKFLGMVNDNLNGDASMALEDTDVRKVWGYDPGAANGDPWPGVSDETFPPGGNGTVAPGTALTYLLKRQRDNHNAVMASLASLADPTKLATAVSASLIPAVLAALQNSGAVELTEAQVQDAAERAMREVLGGLDQ